MNECRKKRGAAVLWGVQKIKEKKKRGARVGPGFEIGFGLETGRVEREYIRAGDNFFSFFSFLSLSSSF